MKKTLTILFLAITTCAFAQLQKEQTYTSQAELINIGPSGSKYATVDEATGVLNLYNLDHTLFKTVSLNIPDGEALYRCSRCDFRENGMVITETLVDNEEDIEVFYRTNYDLRVVDEAGILLLSVPEIRFYDFGFTGTEFKLQVYHSAGSVVDSTSIYSLEGTLPTGSARPNELQNTSAYPNPSTETVTINYVLPGYVAKAELEVVDVQGKVIKSAVIDRTFKNVLLNVSDFNAGMYYYRITAGGKTISASKFIKQ
jgi:hypothetical protein